MAVQPEAAHGRRRQVLAPLSGWLNQRAAAWVRRRQGLDVLPFSLARRRLYILPTRAGLALGGLLVLMLLAGLNYANSLALLLTFLLVAFVLVVMHECHRNLLGVSVVAITAPAVFARSTGALYLTLANPTRLARPQIEAALPHTRRVAADLPAHGRMQLEIAVSAPRRGIVRIERLRLSTAQPFGLFRVWTWVHVPLEMLVYPLPAGILPMPVGSGALAGAHAHGGVGADEWSGLRPFREGDSSRHVDWKAYAREAPLLVKQYSLGASELREFDFRQLAGQDTETRLAQLARWVVDAAARGERYALMLPDVRLAADRGPEHRHRCLTALAMFAEPPGTSADASRG